MKTFSAWAPTLLIISMTGCSADRDAQSVAGHLLDYTAQYKANVDAKIAAEKQFYTTQSETLSRSIMGYADLGQLSSTPQSDSTASPVRDIQKSLLYGTVRVRAEREAREVADSIVSSNSPPVMTQILNYVSNGVAQEQATYNAMAQRSLSLDESFRASLEKIDVQEQLLDAARTELQSLYRTPSNSARLQEILVFAQSVGQQVRSSSPSTSAPKSLP